MDKLFKIDYTDMHFPILTLTFVTFAQSLC